MIRPVISFFQREKFYAALFLMVISFSIFTWLRGGFVPNQPPADSQEVASFKEAEEKLYQKVEQAGSPENYLKDKPAIKNLLTFLTFFIGGAFSLGLLIDFLALFVPIWRKRIIVIPPASSTDWRLSMIPQTAILFLAFMFLLSALMSFARARFFPEISVNVFLLLHATLVDLFCLFAVYFVVRQARGSWSDLGFQIPDRSFFKEVGMGLLCYLAAMPAFAVTLIFLIFLAHFFSYQPPAHPLVNIFIEEGTKSPFLIVYSIFLAAAVGPMIEEVFFRGFCYPIFRAKWGKGMGMVLSSALFALIHYNVFSFWPIFILGMSLAYVYEKRHSLVAPVTLHFVHNVIFMSYFFAAKEVIVKAGGS